MKTTKIMVELTAGYGDGYGVVAVGEDGKLPIEQHDPPRCYSDTNIPIEEWKRNILAQPAVELTDSGVKVPASAVRRVIGPLNCDEAVRIRAGRYTKNWGNRDFVAVAEANELRDAMSKANEQEVYEAMCAIRSKHTD